MEFNKYIVPNKRQEKGEQGNKKHFTSRKNNHKIVGLKPIVSEITLNVNNLNTPVKRRRFLDWTKKQDLTIYYLQENHLNINR